MTALALRDYQVEALDAIAQAERQGIRRQVLVLPTGSGKTVVFTELVRQRGGDALILVHRDELVEQTLEKFAIVAPGLQVGVVKAERNDVQAPVVVASIQTLAREARLQQLRPTFTTVVTDEAHHSAAASDRRVLTYVNALAADGPLLLGCTATPERGDGQGLDDIFQRITYRRDIEQMICAGYLCDVRALRVVIQTDLNRVRVRAGDLDESELEGVMLAANAPARVAEAYALHAENRKGIVFTPSVLMATLTAEALEGDGITAVALSGATPLDERRDILARFRRREIQVICNCMVLTEGFDGPDVECIVVARPTKSRPLYTQMVGRGLRIFPGKPDCLILDVVGASTRFDLVTVDSLVGRPLGDQSLLDVLEEEDEEARRAAQGVGTSTVDSPGALVVVPAELFGRQQFAWVTLNPFHFALPCNDGQLAVRSTDVERWRVTLQTKAGTTVLADAVPLTWALGHAEERVRASGAEKWARRDAGWRAQPVSDKQLDVLRKCRIPIPSGLTKGEASDLITRSMAQPRRPGPPWIRR